MDLKGSVTMAAEIKVDVTYLTLVSSSGLLRRNDTTLAILQILTILYEVLEAYNLIASLIYLCKNAKYDKCDQKQIWQNYGI